MNQVEMAIDRFQTNGNTLRQLTTDEMEFLPLQFILHHSGRDVYSCYHALPHRVKQKIKREEYAECDHFQRNQTRIAIDGKYPLKHTCQSCMHELTDNNLQMECQDQTL